MKILEGYDIINYNEKESNRDKNPADIATYKKKGI